MKLKSCPEDFVVDEISNFVPDPGGRFFVYELEKRSLATLEALRLIAIAAGMRAKDLSAAGLKDKHGLTRQLFSSPQALKTDFEDKRIKLRLVGKSAGKLTAGSIVGNRFEIVMRNLSDADVAVLPRNIDEIKSVGSIGLYAWAGRRSLSSSRAAWRTGLGDVLLPVAFGCLPADLPLTVLDAPAVSFFICAERIFGELADAAITAAGARRAGSGWLIRRGRARDASSFGGFVGVVGGQSSAVDLATVASVAEAAARSFISSARAELNLSRSLRMMEGSDMPKLRMAVVGFSSGSDAIRRAIAASRLRSSIPLPLGRPRQVLFSDIRNTFGQYESS